MWSNGFRWPEYCEAILSVGRSSWKFVHNCRSCKLCPYSSTSLFLMANHVRRRCFRLETFTCDNAKIEAYYCKDCDFKTQLTILFEQYINKQHGLNRESRKDIYPTRISSYRTTFANNATLKPICRWSGFSILQYARKRNKIFRVWVLWKRVPHTVPTSSKLMKYIGITAQNVPTKSNSKQI